MSFTMTKSQMQQATIGATILASGGGGSYQVAKKIIDEGVSNTATVEIVPLSSIEDTLWLCVCANMGSPDALFENTTTHATGNAIEGLDAWMRKAQAGFPGFSYLVPVEVGAINTASPLAAAVQRKLPLIDADGAGRSIPTLPLDTFAANGQPLFPNCIASEAKPGSPYNTAFLHIAGEAPEEQAELAFLGVQMSAPFGGIAGLAMYAMSGADLKQHPPVTGTLSLALKIGEVYGKSSGLDRAKQIANLISASLATCKVVFHGYVTDMVQTSGGTDIGHIVVSEKPDGSGNQLWIYNQNENIYAYRKDRAEPFIISPDSIGYVPAAAGQDIFDNSDLWRLFQQTSYAPIEIYVLATAAPKIITGNARLMESWHDTRAALGCAGLYQQSWLQP